MSEENVEIMRRYYEAWFREDPSEMGTLDPEIELHPDPENEWVGIDDVYRGPRGVLAYMRTVEDAIEDYRPEVEQLIDAGDKVVTLAVESGRGRGSGAEVRSLQTAHVWTLRDGRAIRLDLYNDRSAALRAVGLEEWPVSHKNLEIVRRAFATAGPLTSAPDLAPDAEFDFTALYPDQPVLRGVDAMRAFRDAGPWGKSISFAPERYFRVDDQRVLVFVCATASGQRSGTPVQTRLAHEFTVRRGMIVRVKVHPDREQALKNLGLEE
jgi:ketosteroid isomerase-like protein